MKNILHVHQNFFPYEGGSTQRLLNQLENINRKNFNAIVLSQKIFNEADIEIIGNGVTVYRYKYFYQIFKLIYKINRENGIDLIHSHNFRPSLFSLISNIFLRKKIIIEMHSIYEVKNLINRIVSKFILRFASQIIVLSKESKRILLEDYNISKPIEIIYNGIDIEAFIFSDKKILEVDDNLIEFIRKSRDDNKIIVSYIGSLHPFQGIDNIVKIVNQVNNKNINFILVGGSTLESEGLAKNINNDRTLVLPFINRNTVKSFYKNIDILLMPRPETLATKSAIPLKPIEALASGALVYSTIVGGMLELKEITKSENIIFMTVLEMIEKLNNMNNLTKIDNKITSGNLELFNIKVQVQKLNDLYSDLTK